MKLPTPSIEETMHAILWNRLDWRASRSNFLSKHLIPESSRASVETFVFEQELYVPFTQYLKALNSISWAEKRLIEVLELKEES